MKSKMVSILICLVMVAGIFASITFNLGRLSMNASGEEGLDVFVTSYFSELNSAAQSAITVHITDGTNPVQGATVNLTTDSGGIFSPQSGLTDVNGNFTSIFNAPTVITQIVCRITAQANKTGYNDGTGYVDITIRPIPWPMFRHNLNHTGLSPYDTSANPGKLKWFFDPGDDIYSSPVIGSDGTIYVGSQDCKLHAINLDGTEKWNFTTGGLIYFESPTIDSDGTIYIGSNDHKLYAINPDGSEKWSFMTANYVWSSPAIGSDHMIYVGSCDNNLYAINSDGTEKWYFMTSDIVWSSPAIGSDGTIYVGSYDNKLYAINPDGIEKWNFTTGSFVQSSPVIGSDGTIYVGSNDNKLYAVNPDGSEKWNFTTGSGVQSSPAIGSDGTIYVGSNDYKLYAINPDGTEKWNFTTGGAIQSSPAIGSDGMIYVGSNDYKLYAINPDGIKKWNFTTGGRLESSPAIGSDGTIYVGSGDSKLYAIGAPTQNIIVEKTANVITATPGSTIVYTIYYNNTGQITSYEWVHEQLTFEDSNQYYPRFSPNGNKIVYASLEDPENPPSENLDIWIMNADGSNHQQLTFSDEFQSEPSFSPDGSKIVYESKEDGGSEQDIWIMDADGSNHQQLTFENNSQLCPRFSPDGTKIVYYGPEDGGGDDIWIMNADGSKHQQLTFEDYWQGRPSYSPDGSKIIYQSREDGGGYFDLWIMNADGSNHQPLTFEDHNQRRPNFNSDGNKIVYTSRDGNDRDIWIMDADGSNQQQLTFDSYGQSNPSFSPDGSKIVYYSDEDGGNYYDIWVLNKTSETTAKTVWINDTLPSGVTFITSSAEANRTGDYNWTFYNVGLGEHNFTITVQVNGGVPNGTILTNYVHLDCTDSKGNPLPESSDFVDVIVLIEPPLLPPTLYINISQDGEDVILYWDPPLTPGIDYYLLYRSTSQIGFDFNTVWVNTSKDNETGEPNPIPLRTMWNDTKAALPDDPNYEKEYYYIIRAVNVVGEVSRTSRTVGKWTKTFPQGVSTFSLPLEPLETMNTTIDYYLKDMSARYIKWMDSVNHIWMKHGDGDVNDTQMVVGKGYEVAFDSPTNYTFTGAPGAMIMYDDDTGFLGFDPDSDAKNLTATMDPMTGNVTLNWTKPSSVDVKDEYHVLRSTARDGFWSGNYINLKTLSYDTLSFTDIGNATAGTQYYYMIVPINETGVEGASTYSIGVWTEEYFQGYDTFGIPLKLETNQTADWYCDYIPYTVGINFFNVSVQRWSWHSKEMPKGAFDPPVGMAEGYQISTSGVTMFSFVGI